MKAVYYGYLYGCWCFYCTSLFDLDVPRHITALQMIELIMRQSRRLTNRIAKELDVLWNVVKKNK